MGSNEFYALDEGEPSALQLRAGHDCPIPRRNVSGGSTSSESDIRQLLHKIIHRLDELAEEQEEHSIEEKNLAKLMHAQMTTSSARRREMGNIRSQMNMLAGQLSSLEASNSGDGQPARELSPLEA